MSRLSISLSLLLLAGVVIASGWWAAGAVAQGATPEAGSGTGVTTVVLVEHNDHETKLDLGEPGPSAEDMLVWGPNPLYDEANASDTGATSQGTCVTLHRPDQCLLNETVIFADGSTLHILGIELGGGEPSIRTIVGGSGRYLGATGTLAVSPTEDETLWTKTFAIGVRWGLPGPPRQVTVVAPRPGVGPRITTDWRQTIFLAPVVAESGTAVAVSQMTSNTGSIFLL